jgi:ech hydrogenase subunit C
VSSIERSPWLIHYDASSCNGCDIEVLACLTPVYDAERFGCIVTGDPKQADILLVTGSVNHLNAPILKNIYDQMPEPRAVVAIGACAYSGGVFAECYNVSGGVASTIPVDVYVPGCAAKPESILDGVVRPRRYSRKRKRPCARRAAASVRGVPRPRQREPER